MPHAIEEEQEGTILFKKNYTVNEYLAFISAFIRHKKNNE